MMTCWLPAREDLRGGVAACLALLASVPAAAAQPAEDAVTVDAVPAREVVRPGAQVPVAVVLEHAEGFHTWPHEPELPPEYADVRAIPTDVRATDVTEGVGVGAVQWPEPETVTVRYIGPPVELLSLTDTAIAYLPVTVSPDRKPGKAELAVEVHYQACDERVCYPPRRVRRTVELDVAPPDTGRRADPARPALFGDFEWAAYRDTAGGAGDDRDRARAAELNAFGLDLSFRPDGPAGLGALLLLAAAGGLLLNLTPCVLPLVPIKVMGLRSAASGRAEVWKHAVLMAAGIVTLWLALGGGVALLSGLETISALFRTSWFGPAAAAVVALAALSTMGLFRVRLPGPLTRLDPSPASPAGALGFGAMTAILATPCTAPFMAGASAWAATQSPGTALAVFGAVGSGMASPYLILAVRPGWIGRLPDSGPWNRALEESMGLLLLAVAVFFVGSSSTGGELPLLGVSYWWGVGFFVAAALAWAAVRVWRLGSSGAVRWGTSAAALAGVVITGVVVGGMTASGPIDWVRYTPDEFAEARAAGRVVVMDFTAEWCLNCKALEEGVLHREKIVELLDREGIVPMRVDLTDENPPGRARLRELNWVGLPLLAVFGPGTGFESPIKYDSYTVPMVRRAVDEARGRSR